MFSPRRHEDHEEVTKIRFDDTSRQVIDAAFKVHQEVGPGLLEGIYEECLAIELRKRRVPFVRQLEIPIIYEGEKIPLSYRLDLVVGDSVVVELKSVEKILPVHTAQVLTYLKTSGFKAGLLINFAEPYFKAAVKRFVF
jgi:GxxExxY protein